MTCLTGEESPIDSAVGHVTTCFSSWRQLSLGSLSSGGHHGRWLWESWAVMGPWGPELGLSCLAVLLMLLDVEYLYRIYMDILELV